MWLKERKIQPVRRGSSAVRCLCALSSCRMSDLALPFLLVLEDDGLAFWCFVALMNKVGLYMYTCALARTCFNKDMGNLPRTTRRPACMFHVLRVRVSVCMPQVRRNFTLDESGLFAQLRAVSEVIKDEDTMLYDRLHQVG